MIGKIDLISLEMHEMEIQTIEPVYTREVNERMVKCIESTYSKTDIEHVAADATHLNAE